MGCIGLVNPHKTHDWLNTGIQLIKCAKPLNQYIIDQYDEADTNTFSFHLVLILKEMDQIIIAKNETYYNHKSFNSFLRINATEINPDDTNDPYIFLNFIF